MFDMRDPFKLLTLIKNNYGIPKNKIFQKKWGKKQLMKCNIVQSSPLMSKHFTYIRSTLCNTYL